MKTELIFFESKEQSIEGIKRGLVAFITLILCNFLLFRKPKCLQSFLICCALGVQIPKSYNEVLVYSFLVGLVVFQFDIISILICMLAGSFTYLFRF